MAQSTVNIQKMKGASSELDKIYASMMSYLKKLYENMAGLGKIWKGEGAAAYQKAYLESTGDFLKLTEAIRSCSLSLGTIATTYGKADTAAAEAIDGYTERVNQIRGKLGSDDMLSEVRNNLQKFGVMLTESTTVLSTSGDFLMKAVEGYTALEARQVKKVDGLKAHNRDFYKNPVVVASAGGAAAGTAAAIPVSAGAAPTQTTSAATNHTVNTTVNSHAPTEPAAGLLSNAAPGASPRVSVSPSAGAPPSVGAPAASTRSAAPPDTSGGISRRRGRSRRWWSGDGRGRYPLKEETRCG